MLKNAVLAAKPLTRIAIKLPAYQIVTKRYATATSLPPSLTSSPLFAKLHQAPKVIDSVHRIIQLFKDRGIKMDQQPTFTDMMKLSRDEEVQAALLEMKKNLDEAGVTLDIQELLKHMPNK